METISPTAAVIKYCNEISNCSILDHHCKFAKQSGAIMMACHLGVISLDEAVDVSAKFLKAYEEINRTLIQNN